MIKWLYLLLFLMILLTCSGCWNKIEHKNLAYDSDSGRIVDAYYFSEKAKIAEVSSYYIDTLPQLGWKKTKPFEYKREGEVLKLNITGKEGVTYLKFTVRPAVNS